MMNRISLTQIFSRGLSGILNAQTQITKTQQQISTGKRVLTPSDDPIAAARILQLESEQARTVQYQKNIDGATTSLEMEEAQLEAFGNVLTLIREKVVQAGDGALSFSERQAIAEELATRLEELGALANSRSPSGEYIFGGYKGEQEPFVRVGNNYTYRGDDGQRFLQIASSTQVATNDSGNAIFMAIPQANVAVAADAGNTSAATISRGRVVNLAAFNATFTGPTATFQIDVTGFTAPDQYTYNVVDSGGATVVTGATFTANEPFTFGGTEFRIAGDPIGTAPAVGDSFSLTPPTTQSVFATVGKLVDGLRAYGDSSTDKLRLQDLIGESLDNLDNAEDNINVVRSRVGARLNTLDSTAALHEGTDFVNQKVLADIRDVDPAEAISKMTQENFVLQAAQQSFAKIAGLSLFDFLR